MRNGIRAGAPDGNSNALRHGYRTAKADAARKRMIVRFRKLYRAIDAIGPVHRAGGDVAGQCEYVRDLLLSVEAS